MTRIDAPTLRAWLTDGSELALLDAREEAEFGGAHLFWAVPCPLSRREIRARALVPRRTTRTVCLDDGGGLAERLAAWLKADGCEAVSVLDGGTRAWEAAGGKLFSGVNLPSKAFGEWVEHRFGTESVDASVLKAWLDEGRDMVVLDSRTEAEFQRMAIPRGINVPGGELVYRIGDLAPDPKTLVVVNCAGRTRSILGAESLRRIGLPNKVVALRNGTMGWELAGFACEQGRDATYAPGTPRSIELARERARCFAEASGVRVIYPFELDRLEEDSDRTLYLLDVRSPGEFHAGARLGSRNAPGGQLIQATDQWIGVRNARIVLLDDDCVRGRMAGAWLRQMGHRDVFVVDGGGFNAAGGSGRICAPIPELGAPVPSISVAALAARLDDPRLRIVDVALSTVFREGHIIGGLWGVRTRLDRVLQQLASASMVVVTSPDGQSARLAVDELAALTDARVWALEGGTAAWRAAGHALEASPGYPPDTDCIDAYLRPYDRTGGVREAMRDYLAWEVDLLRAIGDEEGVRFGVDC